MFMGVVFFCSFSPVEVRHHASLCVLLTMALSCPKSPVGLEMQWQYCELATSDASVFPGEDPQFQWKLIGQKSADRLLEAWVSFQNGGDGEFLMTHLLGGSFKWVIAEVKGYNIIAHHISQAYVALWLKPLLATEVQLSLEKTFVDYRLHVSNPFTMALHFSICDIQSKYDTWQECLTDVIGRMHENGQITDMEQMQACVKFLFKGKYLKPSNKFIITNDDHNTKNKKKDEEKKKGDIKKKSSGKEETHEFKNPKCTKKPSTKQTQEKCIKKKPSAKK